MPHHLRPSGRRVSHRRLRRSPDDAGHDDTLIAEVQSVVRSIFACAALALLFASAAAHAQASTVILVRHAEKAAKPVDDPPLTNDGKARARDLAAAVADARVSTVIATQFVRTQATAKPAADAAGKTTIIVPATADPKAHADSVAAKVRAPRRAARCWSLDTATRFHSSSRHSAARKCRTSATPSMRTCSFWKCQAAVLRDSFADGTAFPIRWAATSARDR